MEEQVKQREKGTFIVNFGLIGQFGCFGLFIFFTNHACFFFLFLNQWSGGGVQFVCSLKMPSFTQFLIMQKREILTVPTTRTLRVCTFSQINGHKEILHFGPYSGG